MFAPAARREVRAGMRPYECVPFGCRALLRLSIAHELDSDHQAAPAHIADEPMPSRQLLTALESAPCRRHSASGRSEPVDRFSAAAHASGLPPNVLECAPTGQSMTSSRAIVTPIGSPEAIPFAAMMMSGWTPACSIANILPVRPMPDCTSSTTNNMPCWRGDRGEALKKLRRWNDIPALALYGLDDDRSDFVGRRPPA